MIISLRTCLFLLLTAVVTGTQAQQKFSRMDHLHGKLTPLRTCFDLKHYTIAVKVDPARKWIGGRNEIRFQAVNEFRKLQLDFAMGMKIDSMSSPGRKVKYTRDSDAVYVQFDSAFKTGTIGDLTVYFSGIPREAKNAPWDGGFVWAKDSAGQDWVGMACEGIGASFWLPCKDHWSDEVDSLDMHLITPHYLVGVSNGNLVNESRAENGWKDYHWKVTYPINNYGISINVGDYFYTLDMYTPEDRKEAKSLLLGYYLHRNHVPRAREHFLQVKRMLECYERYFGPYPFWNDAYKLVDAPYWGMEHQSCIAYGNDYKNNRYGFDFIIIHESAHEWFANSITASDPSDMWIHESFTTYAEALYVECRQGAREANNYLNEQRPKIKCLEPMVGPRDVFYHGRKDNDIYYKGTWMLHTMRNVINNDSLWFATLKGFYQQFDKHIIRTEDVIAYFNSKSTYKWDHFFQQYLYDTRIPELEYRIVKNEEGIIELRYRWKNTVKGFDMPIQVTVTKDRWDIITPTESWQLIDLNYFNESDIKFRTDGFLFNTKKIQ